MTDIILQTYQVLDEIKNDPNYIELKRLDKLIVENYGKEIFDFQSTKISYDQIMQEGGTYHPDFKEVANKLSEAKKALYSKEEMKMYLDLEKKIQDELNDFIIQITSSISKYIKTPNKLGIVSKGGSCHVG